MKKRKIVFAAFVCVFLAQSYQAVGQFTSEEVAEREKWEEFLKTAEVVETRDIGDGVTLPLRVFLEKDGLETSGVWKNIKGMHQGYLEGWQYEIAAYEMDKLVGLNMIPPTVERKVKGLTGSLQLWIEHDYNLQDLVKKKIKIPSLKVVQIQKLNYLVRAFDSLIANEDRHQRNVIFTGDWRMILIDHSRTFRFKMKFANRLVYGKRGLLGRKLFKRLPQTFVEKVEELDKKKVQEAVGAYLTNMEMQGIMIRKKLLLKEIEEMIKEQGRDKVLY